MVVDEKLPWMWCHVINILTCQKNILPLSSRSDIYEAGSEQKSRRWSQYIPVKH
jgi:hypothetical protein